MRYWITKEYIEKENGREEFFERHKDDLLLMANMLELMGFAPLVKKLICALERMFTGPFGDEEEEINFGFSEENNNNRE